jgi:hypothetical protein
VEKKEIAAKKPKTPKTPTFVFSGQIEIVNGDEVEEEEKDVESDSDDISEEKQEEAFKAFEKKKPVGGGWKKGSGKKEVPKFLFSK